MTLEATPKEGLKAIMEATKATEQSQDSRRHYDRMADRYGKIGISAVAAAVRHQGERHNTHDAHQPVYETD